MSASDHDRVKPARRFGEADLTAWAKPAPDTPAETKDAIRRSGPPARRAGLERHRGGLSDENA
jgi:hypothetical protein